MSRSILVAYSSESDDRGAMDLAQELVKVTGASLSELRLPEDESPARAVTAAVEEQRPALVVLASPGGGAAEHVIHGARCPVVVVPRGYEATRPRTVGAAFVATPEGHEALRAAVALAGAFGARLRLVTALSPKHAEESEGLLARSHHDHNAADDVALRHTREAEEAVQRAIGELAPGLEVETDELFQEPAHALVAASGNLDLLVMGSRARGPVKSVLLGSVSRHVIAEASCPVLVVERGTEGAVEAMVSGAGAGTGDGP
jgi:nucleotide-binding universal stress UspA family protein